MKNNKFFWYVDKNSMDAQNHLDLGDVIECHIKDEPKVFCLDIQVKNKKKT